MPQMRALLCVSVLLFGLTATVYSQTTFASITGTVTDATGAVVPNATVTATSVQTNIKTTAKSNEDGNYTVAQLKQGTDTVRAEAAGFKSFVMGSVGVVARDVRRVDVRLEIGDVATEVKVSGGVTLIETETARISDTKDSLVLNNVPTNSRSLWAILNLAPGLQWQAGSSVTRFAGSRVNENNWSIDGTTFSDGVDNTQTGPLANYIESFQEVKVDLSNNSAEFASIGQVTIISKSGTNELHGSLFDYYSTPWFRAKGFFDSSRSTGISHFPGGSIGGPVRIPKIYDGRNKTFFYFSYETSRGSARQDRLNPTVAPVSWRTGDFSGLGTPIIDPSSGLPFSNNQIPADRINAVSKKIQDKFFPQPNFGDPNTFHTQNYRELKIRSWDPSTYWTTRIDHKVSDKDQIMGRYTWVRGYNRNWEGNLPTIGQRWQQRDDRAATTSYSHSFRPNLLNEIRWGFGLNNNPINFDVNLGSTQHGLQLANELGLVGLAPNLPDINGILRLTFSNGMTGLNQYPWRKQGYRTHSEEFQDHLSWFKGRHNLKFGFKLIWNEWDDFGASDNLFGKVGFTNRFTGHPYADFLLGIPTTAARAFPPIRIDRTRWSYDLFVTDDFKVRPDMTLNVGLRYELHPGWTETTGRQALFDVRSGTIIVPDGSLSLISPLQPRGYVDVVEASRAGLDANTLLKTDVNNLAPRIGIAYRPWGNDTVIRGGYGIFFDIIPRTVTTGAAPFVVNEPNFTNPTAAPSVIFPRVFPATVGG